MTNYYNTASDYPNADGLMPILYSIRDGIPYSFDAVLFVIFLALVLGQYFINKVKTGRGKILPALFTSTMTNIILALLLALARLVTYMEPVFYAFASIVFFILIITSDSW